MVRVPIIIFLLLIQLPIKATIVPVPKGLVKGMYSDIKPTLYFCPDGKACMQEEAFRIVFEEESNIDFQEINELGPFTFVRFIFPENISIRESLKEDFSDLFNVTVSYGFEQKQSLSKLISKIEHNENLDRKAYIDIKIPQVKKSLPSQIHRSITLKVNKNTLLISHNISTEALLETQIVSSEDIAKPDDDQVISRNSFDVMTPNGEFSSEKLIKYTVTEIGDDMNCYNYL
ncbi:MAG: hypothetical protein HRT47_11045 [Candidatus Caenarcaniphilales bacterium]|nr:hypothetical protein [Candidatus Caenarcaniphilales bacterium]